MTPHHIGWQARAPKPCRKCGAMFQPTGPRAKHCPQHQDKTTCRHCGVSYPRHRAHACQKGLTA